MCEIVDVKTDNEQSGERRAVAMKRKTFSSCYSSIGRLVEVLKKLLMSFCPPAWVDVCLSHFRGTVVVVLLSYQDQRLQNQQYEKDDT
jgi:hypothetical protein